MSASIEERKKAIFDSMSKKRRIKILRKTSYKEWNPFEEPKDPIDIRKDKTKRTYSTLLREFLESDDFKNKKYSDLYRTGLLEMIIGLVNNDDHFIAMYDFSVWYSNLLKQEGLDL